MIKNSLKVLALIFFTLFFLPCTATEKESTYLVIAYGKDETGNYVGHEKFTMLSSDWKKVGKDKAKWTVENNLGATYKSSTAIHPGECYVLYTSQSPGKKLKIHRAPSNSSLKRDADIEKIKGWEKKFPKDNFKYIEDGCNLNLSAQNSRVKGPESFDSFETQFKSLLLKEGTFDCKDNKKDVFKVQRIRPGLYYFTNEKNGYKIPLNINKALSEDASHYDIQKTRNNYHYAMSKMCEKYVAPQKGTVDIGYEFIKSKLLGLLEDCRNKNSDEDDCKKIEARIAATGRKG